MLTVAFWFPSRATDFKLEGWQKFWYDVFMNIGQRLYELRAAKGFSQGEIEKRTGLLRCNISRVENGRIIPSLETLEKLARALEIELYQVFFEGKGKPATAIPKKTTGLDVDEHMLFGTFRKLNKKDQKLAVGMIGKMARTGQSAK